ncbi:hypothetical protein AHAS_Ahas12G0062700 [Arachis hypogaea]
MSPPPQPRTRKTPHGRSAPISCFHFELALFIVTTTTEDKGNPTRPSCPNILFQQQWAHLLGFNTVPSNQAANSTFAINNSMEDWLLKVCYDATIPMPIFYRNETFLTQNDGSFYGFQVVLPGHPFGIHLHAKGRYSLVERDARQDPTYCMLDTVLHMTHQKIRNYNYLRATIILQEANNDCIAWITELEKKCEYLEAFYNPTNQYVSSS